MKIIASPLSRICPIEVLKYFFIYFNLEKERSVAETVTGSVSSNKTAVHRSGIVVAKT
jgi:hypothetical protein